LLEAITYLGRYLYRGVIQEKDILACENGKVIFRYCDSKTRQWVYRTVSGAKFLWLIVQHVLPKGFRRARNYGFLHSNNKRLIQLIQYLLNLEVSRDHCALIERPKIRCVAVGRRWKLSAHGFIPCQIIVWMKGG
jgi:hypothetical protein